MHEFPHARLQYSCYGNDMMILVRRPSLEALTLAESMPAQQELNLAQFAVNLHMGFHVTMKNACIIVTGFFKGVKTRWWVLKFQAFQGHQARGVDKLTLTSLAEGGGQYHDGYLIKSPALSPTLIAQSTPHCQNAVSEQCEGKAGKQSATR